MICNFVLLIIPHKIWSRRRKSSICASSSIYAYLDPLRHISIDLHLGVQGPSNVDFAIKNSKYNSGSVASEKMSDEAGKRRPFFGIIKRR